MRTSVITIAVLSLAYALYVVAHNLPAAIHFPLKLVLAVSVLLDAVFLGRYMFLFKTTRKPNLAGSIVMLSIGIPLSSAEAMVRTMLVMNPWDAALAIVYLAFLLYSYRFVMAQAREDSIQKML